MPLYFFTAPEPGVVSGKGEGHVAFILFQQAGQQARTRRNVLFRVEGICDAQFLYLFGHQLHQAMRPGMGNITRVAVRLLPDHGAYQFGRKAVLRRRIWKSALRCKARRAGRPCPSAATACCRSPAPGKIERLLRCTRSGRRYYPANPSRQTRGRNRRQHHRRFRFANMLNRDCISCSAPLPLHNSSFLLLSFYTFSL